MKQRNQQVFLPLVFPTPVGPRKDKEPIGFIRVGQGRWHDAFE